MAFISGDQGFQQDLPGGVGVVGGVFSDDVVGDCVGPYIAYIVAVKLLS